MDRFDSIYSSDGSLNEKLKQYSYKLKIDRPRVFKAYTNMVDRLQAAGAGGGVPKVGEKLPEFLLPDHQGNLISSKELLEKGPLVISFNRGYWCSYCRFELLSLAELYPEIKKSGGEIISIMPDRAVSIQKIIKKNQLPYPILSDIDNGYALACGLMVSLGQELRKLFVELGTDLPKVHGNEGWFVPIPANFILDQEGVIGACFVDADFRHRMAPAEILKYFS